MGNNSYEVTDQIKVGSIHKNKYRNVEVTVGEYQDRLYVRCQVVRREDAPPEPGDLKHQGLTFRPNVALQMIPLLTKAVAMAEAKEKEMQINKGRQF